MKGTFRIARRCLALALAVGLLLAACAPEAVTAQRPSPPQAPPDQRIWPDERIYFIMIDRFHNGDPDNDLNVSRGNPRGWHGGDIRGIIAKLDYIRDLGFTAIWITPHVKNTGNDYHGYGAVDFYQTDPHFGTNESVQELVREAHARGLKVIFDIVVNHTGPHHPLVREKPEWFHPRRSITNWNDDRQVQEGWLFNLPDFDQSKPEVRAYILDYSRFWIEETGVDGFRLDTVKHIHPDFWTWYVPQLRAVRSDFWVIGEVWHSSPFKLAEYQKAGVTALIDFPVSETARDVFGKDRSMTALAGVIRQVEAAMVDPWQMGAFLDNHDMPRFVTHAKDDPIRRLKLGLTWLFTQRSIPIVYYGTEIALKGGQDPYNRPDFPWGKEENLEVREWVRALNAIRAKHIALRRGTVENLMADRWRYAYARQYEGSTVIVALNNHPEEPFGAAVDVTALGLPDGTVLVDELSGHQVTVAGGKIHPPVEARSGAVYVVQPQARYPEALWAALAALALLTAAFFLGRRWGRP